MYILYISFILAIPASPNSIKNIDVELLQKRIAQLEEENKAVRDDAFQLAKETCEVEEHEKKLMAELTMQLNTTNRQFEEIRKFKYFCLLTYKFIQFFIYNASGMCVFHKATKKII